MQDTEKMHHQWEDTIVVKNLFFLYEGRRMSRKIKLSVIYIRFESEQAKKKRREKHFS